MSRTLAVIAALATLLVSQVALACPVCAQRDDGGLLGTLALGTLVVMPWIVAATIAFYIRRESREAASLSSETTE